MGMKYFRNANFIFWVGKDMQFYFLAGKGKTRVGGSVNHKAKNSLLYLNIKPSVNEDIQNI